MSDPSDPFLVCPKCGRHFPEDSRFCSQDATRLPAPPARAAPADPWLGQIIGERFRLVRRIGEGSYGVVYEAVHEDHRRRVAVKLIHQLRVHEPEARARILREAQILSALGHQHIVKLFDFGHTTAGIPFLVLEYIDGTPLAQVLKEVRKLSPGRAVDVAHQVALALAYLHERGVLHRDLKAANIMLQLRDGQPDFVTLVDFGIAKVLDAPALTVDQRQPGTLAYMPPEAFSAAAPTPAFDLYSLGVLLYELLVGASPFQGEGYALLQSKEAAPTRPSERDEQLAIPVALDDLVVSLLQPDPAKRPATREVIAALEQVRVLLPRRSPGSLQLERTYLLPGRERTGAATILLPLAAQADALSAACEQRGQRLLDRLAALIQHLPSGVDRDAVEAKVRWQHMESLQRQEEREGIDLALLADRLADLRAEENAERERLRQESLQLSLQLRGLSPSAPEYTVLLLKRRDVELREASYALPQIGALEAEVQATRQLVVALRDQRDEAVGRLARLLEKVPCPPEYAELRAQVADLRAQLEASTAALARLLGREDPKKPGPN